MDSKILTSGTSGITLDSIKNVFNTLQNKLYNGYVVLENSIITIPKIKNKFTFLPYTTSRTISLELISTKPLKAPSYGLNYVDYLYKSAEEIRKEELVKKIKSRKNKIDILLGKTKK